MLTVNANHFNDSFPNIKIFTWFLSVEVLLDSSPEAAHH